MIKLTAVSNESTYTIRACRADGIVINDTCYPPPLLISAQQLEQTALPHTVAAITDEHITRILALKPTLVIIGSGQFHQPLDHRLSQPLLCQGIGMEVMTTVAACRTFNILMSEQRHAVALLMA